ncbi:hypothetical protein [uncultured Polaribacter sp.]|uniref:hypothetical protein n=1 Tax=uncultured Polaribacter sp. TaxID=174711 RepID=UPI0026299C17|nr:hypothetical protein [uncultured Polaribacter sp.]
MKKIVLFTLLLFTVISFSQSKKNVNYDKLSNPNPKNDLSTYLDDLVPNKYLKKARFQKNSKNIILYFNVNKEHKPFKISLSAYQPSDLYNSIKNAFKDYPLERLSIENFDRKNRYSLQIISKKGRRNIFNTRRNTRSF